MNDILLIENAIKARKLSYSPYSGFAVGAAVLADSGKIYKGANIENASYGATVCAERNAIFQAVLAGEKKILAVAVTGGKENEEVPSDYAYPCGMCRQVMTEFGESDMIIIVAKSVEDYKKYRLDELLPHGFIL